MKIAVKCIHLQLDGGGMEHCSRFRRFGEEEIEKRERERDVERARKGFQKAWQPLINFLLYPSPSELIRWRALKNSAIRTIIEKRREGGFLKAYQSVWEGRRKMQ